MFKPVDVYNNLMPCKSFANSLLFRNDFGKVHFFFFFFTHVFEFFALLKLKWHLDSDKAM